jgi:uncharacterized protein (DUF1684 family)
MTSYSDEILRWRADMEARLRNEDGWLALAGLFWLHEGQNSVGADPASDVVLPAGKAPGRLATLRREGQQVWLEPQPGAGLLVNGEPATERELRSDASKPYDTLAIGDLSFFVIKRGERIGVRLRDRAHPRRTTFEGRRWYAVQEQYRVWGQLVRHDPPRTIAIPNILGDTELQDNPGAIEFTLQGQTLRLEATDIGSRQLFIIFRDQTSGVTTYGPGRFLTAAVNDDGVVDLDFNRAYSPPCAFTDYATCPLPPRENHLPLAIEAGELVQPEDGH